MCAENTAQSNCPMSYVLCLLAWRTRMMRISSE